MSFAHAWVLALIALPVAWAAWEWRRSHRRLGLALKAAVFALILLALAEPRLSLWETDLAVAVLADASSSTPRDQIAEERELIERIQAAAGSNLVRPIAFADSARRGMPDEGDEVARLRGTNLEAAIRGALSALPSDRVSRIVLASDGQETAGSVERAVYQARERGVPIDVIPLAGRPSPALLLHGATNPAQAFVGEQFPIDIAVSSPEAAAATVQLSADGRSLGASEVHLRQGENHLRVRASIDVPGSTLISGMILGGKLGDAPFSGVVTLAKPRALLIASAGEGEQGHFRQVLTAAGFELNAVGGLSGVRSPAQPGLTLRQSYDVIVADNQDFEAWPRNRKDEIEEFVAAGGGFLLIAGENNLYVEREETDETDPLNRMLPATLAPPRTPEGTAVVLVLDKSSSMEGKKMTLARQSAMGLVDALRPFDWIGVLAFDNSFEWAIELRKNDQPAALKSRIEGIIADGGTQIAPALSEAYRRISPQEAIYKHILLLTDGISEEGDSIQLARQAASEKITISTIGLGQDVNRAYLERVATTAEGRSYFVIEVEQLAQVVLRDVLEHTGSSVTEREFVPEIAEESEIFDRLEISEAGPLLGWVRFEAKPSAETLLMVDEEDPLLVRRQHGLGRAAVFASDAKNRWAANWVAWQGFDRFWANVVRDLLPRASVVEVDTEFDPAVREILVSYRGPLDAGGAAPKDVFVIGPDGFRAAAELRRTAANAFEARVPIGDRFGLFRIGAGAEAGLLPETAYYRANQELTRFGSNPALLRALADATGGLYDPQPQEIFSAGERAVETTLNLWPGLLALAVLLNLVELLARKGWLPWLGRWA